MGAFKVHSSGSVHRLEAGLVAVAHLVCRCDACPCSCPGAMGRNDCASRASG